MNKETANQLLYSLRLSDLAYQNGLTATSVGLPLGLVIFMDGTNSAPPENTQGYIVFNREENIAYVVFRGSEEKYADWWEDYKVKYQKLDFDNAILRVHSGFLNQYRSIDSQLMRFFQFNNKNIDTIVFCGHGLGGALAMIAAVYYHSRHRNNDKMVKVHTFGAPRVGDAAFCDFFKDGVDEHWRVYNQGDPAPTFPAHKSLSPPFIHPAGPTVTLKPPAVGGESVTYSMKGRKTLDCCGDFVGWDTVDHEEHQRALYVQRLQAVGDLLV